MKIKILQMMVLGILAGSKASYAEPLEFDMSQVEIKDKVVTSHEKPVEILSLFDNELKLRLRETCAWTENKNLEIRRSISYGVPRFELAYIGEDVPDVKGMAVEFQYYKSSGCSISLGFTDKNENFLKFCIETKGKNGLYGPPGGGPGDYGGKELTPGLKLRGSCLQKTDGETFNLGKYQFNR